ncbi:cyclase family protein [Candidatus Latescibacterota bacterium]
MHQRIATFCVYFIIGIVFSFETVYAQTPDSQRNMRKVIDMSHVFHPGQESRTFDIDIFGANGVDPSVQRKKGYWYVMHNVTLHNHNCTHIEFPYHVLENGYDCASFPLEKLCGDAVVLDLRDCPPKSVITARQIENAAQKAGGIKRGDIVLCNLGYAGHFRTEKYSQTPTFSTESIVWLVNAGMKLMGVDATGVEISGGEENINHHALLDNDIALIENLAGFDGLTKTRIQLYAFPIAVKGLDSFPVRVVAIEED